MGIQDSSYKLLFSYREMVADLIRGFVPGPWVGQLDLTTLERVREVCVSIDLREREDDIIWRLRLGEDWLYLYLVLEFQSSVDRFMAVRLSTYIGLLYEDLIKAKEVPPGAKLPPVLPMVLYNGVESWWAKCSLAELGASRLPAELVPYQPQLRYLLLAEQAYDEAALAAMHNLVAALFRLEHSRTPEDFDRVLATLIDWLRDPAQEGLRRAFLVFVKRVLLPRRLPGVEIPGVIELQEMRAMLAQEIKPWTEQWKEQGLEEGRREGRREGRQEGEARLLSRRQLTVRFGTLPEWVEQRLVQAGEEQLEGWGERLLTVASLEELFQETP